MSRILVLADSGFGMIFKGLNPENTYVISVTTKPLPWKGSGKTWPVAPNDKLSLGKRVICDDADKIVKALETLVLIPHIKVVVLDDLNYIMQDWYMANALRTGWDAPKQIGVMMGKIFKTIEAFQGYDKHIIVLAHSEIDDKKSTNERKYHKFKTTGKMVDEYVTPEGKFDITLIGESFYDTKEKKVIKRYVTNEDATHSSAKSPIGMFPQYVSNDLGAIIGMVDAYYNGE
jgi:hypothetical protein